MVKPVATNMTITLHTPLQRSGDDGATVKPLVIGEQMVVHTNAANAPILPYQPVALEQDQTPKAALSLDSTDVLAQAPVRHVQTSTKLQDFTREQIELLSNRYKITR